ncbi:MAG: sugar phosphate isomerase/epimerase [Sedimentisphaerales bacterium]|nr:sugar phosphate isomerase/epimerase [Sedimentisphaerales bacterium]
MTELRSGPSRRISRRAFCRSALAAGMALPFGVSVAGAAGAKKNVKFYKNLGPGHIGVRANQQQALDYAARFGFDSITPSAGEFAGKSEAEIRAWLGTMKDKGVRYGSAGLPFDFRRDEARFESGLAGLARQAKVLQQLGVKRMATWILPGHNELTYLQNFKRHERRLREAAKVLKDYDIRLGLEFVGPRTSRRRNRFPFICTQHGMMELADAIGTGNVGLLMDSWHWYTSHGTVEELLSLSGKDIVHVHVNDAPEGIDVDEQIDSRRCLPVTTGVIDMKGFVNALAKIGYDGPVECEPFDQELRQVDDPAAVEKTAKALESLWNLIEA